MVRLKALCAIALFIFSSFQFLYGAIKSLLNGTGRNVDLPFQFLYGAIKSALQGNVSLLKPDFNSSMVRLKGYHDQTQQPYSR